MLGQWLRGQNGAGFARLQFRLHASSVLSTAAPCPPGHRVVSGQTTGLPTQRTPSAPASAAVAFEEVSRRRPRRRFVPHLADRAWPRRVYGFASSGSEARVFTETGPWPNMPFQADEAPKAGPSGRPPWTSPLNAGVGWAEKIGQRMGAEP